MRHFPAFLELRGRDCLVVGGGEVATRKAHLLCEAGASTTIVSPAIGKRLRGMVAAGRVRWVARRFFDHDVADKWLVVTATGVRKVDDRVAAACERARVFCNSVDDLPNCSFITPAIVDRSPLTIAISSGGAAPVLARQLRARIEAMLPATLGRVAALAGRWRGRVRDEIGNLAERRMFWERFFERAGTFDDTDTERMITEMLHSREPATGFAWLVGAGPGDPGLLTLAALHSMQAADVIVHDRLVSGEVLALARRDAQLVPVGKAPGCRKNTQESINALLVRLVAQGKRVCRLKGGDPFIFGRGGEEAQALSAAGLDYRVVPGITAASGCAAAAGIPLTHRDAAQSVVFLTAHGKDSVDTLDWRSLARDRQTLAFYMGVRRFVAIADKLITHGRSGETPVAIVERGTTSAQRVYRGTLRDLPQLASAHRIAAPAMLIVGEVARYGSPRQPATIDQASSRSNSASNRLHARSAWASS